eukprot:scaffold598390_cov71-Attheya_sp.AAC.1
MVMYDKECAMVIAMLQRKQSRANAQSTDDNGDATHAPSSCTTNSNDDTDSLSDTAHVDDNGEEEIPDLPVPQLDFDVGFQLNEFFESYGWYTFSVTKVLKDNMQELEYQDCYSNTVSSVETLELLSAMPGFGKSETVSHAVLKRWSLTRNDPISDDDSDDSSTSSKSDHIIASSADDSKESDNDDASDDSEG